MDGRQTMSKFASVCIVAALLAAPGATLAQDKGAKPREDAPFVASKEGNSSGTPVEPIAKPVPSDPKYVIVAGDEVIVNVWGDSNLSRTVSVRPDGNISLPLLDDIKASGLTPMQLGAEIASRLKKFVSDAQVTIIMSRTTDQRIFILGEVPRTGAYPLLPKMTVLEAISSAGGFTAFAKQKKVHVLRTEDGKQVRLPFNYKDVIKGTHPEQNILLRAGDTIIVP
jgi:polysaccharide export outer membrane protein